jgi:signal transduction histidine kinase
MEWHLSRCDLKNLIEDALAATDGLFREKGVLVRVELDGDLPPLTIDRDRLMQVVINLLSNAAKFVQRAKGEVRVLLGQGPGGLTVSVEDNGPGIPVAARETVFEKFNQAVDPVAGKPQGTGLGLTICRHIVEHFGGRIWVEDAKPSGAAFRFTLPTAAPEPTAGED